MKKIYSLKIYSLKIYIYKRLKGIPQGQRAKEDIGIIINNDMEKE